jgi:hypothetical protein
MLTGRGCGAPHCRHGFGSLSSAPAYQHHNQLPPPTQPLLTQNNAANVFHHLHKKKPKQWLVELNDKEYTEMFGE